MMHAISVRVGLFIIERLPTSFRNFPFRSSKPIQNSFLFPAIFSRKRSFKVFNSGSTCFNSNLYEVVRPWLRLNSMLHDYGLNSIFSRSYFPERSRVLFSRLLEDGWMCYSRYFEEIIQYLLYYTWIKTQ